MKKTHFENLRVYQLSEQLSDSIWQMVQAWASLEKNTVGAQVIRSADSIGANLAEGSGRGSNADYRRFIRMSRGSLYETRHWLRRAYRRGLLSQEQIQELSQIIDELTPKLNAYLKSIGTFGKSDDQDSRDS